MAMVEHAGGSRVHHGSRVAPGRAPWRMAHALGVQSRETWPLVAGRPSAHPQPSRTVETPHFYILYFSLLLTAVAAVSCLIALSLKLSTMWQPRGSSSCTPSSSACDNRRRCVRVGAVVNTRIFGCNELHAGGQDDDANAPFPPDFKSNRAATAQSHNTTTVNNTAAELIPAAVPHQYSSTT